MEEKRRGDGNREKRGEEKGRKERRKKESEGVRGRDEEGNGRLSRRIALLMESWLSVGSRYNLHYIYLPGFVVLPKCRPEGPPPSKHKAVKRFNSIRTAQSRGGGVDSTNLTPSDSFTLRNSSLARVDLTALPQRFNTFHCPPLSHPFATLSFVIPRCFDLFFPSPLSFSLRSVSFTTR